MGRVLLAIALLATFAIGRPALAQQAPESIEGATTVDPAAAKTLWDQGVRFVDVRGISYWEVGRIPGAADLDFFTAYTEDSLLKVAGKNDEVVIYCSGPG